METDSIRATPAPVCALCGAAGEVLYRGLRDRSYAAPGEWALRRCTNPICGLGWLDPRPLEEDIGKAYQTYYTHQQPEPGAAWLRDAVWAVWHAYLGVRFGYRQGVGPRWRRWVAPLARLHPGGQDELEAAAMYLHAPAAPARVLDVGCGSGVLLARMKALGWEVEGVEVDEAAARLARARGVSVRVGTLAAQCYPENHFDAVHSAHVLEHVHDPAGLLRECARILKPGGRLVVLTPNFASRGHARFGAAWLNLDPPRHLFLFTPATLRRLVEQGGLTVDTLRTTARNAWVYGALSRRIERTGRADIQALGRRAGLAYGVAYQLRMRWWLRTDAAAGDEILVMARKS